MLLLLAALGGLLFGALDQYLGSLISLGPWAASVSGLSAPWLVLPFLAGLSQTRTRRAILAGTAVVLAALLGYFVMTVSPFEGVPVARFGPSLVAMGRANLAWVAGGLLLAPLFGVLGQRWRVSRSWLSAAVLAGTVCLEPAARWAAGRPSAVTTVWLAEVSVGLLLAGAFLLARQHSRAAR